MSGGGNDGRDVLMMLGGDVTAYVVISLYIYNYDVIILYGFLNSTHLNH